MNAAAPNQALQEARPNVAPGILQLAGFTCKDIIKLCAEGIKVDLAPENAMPNPNAVVLVGTWKVPNTCLRAVRNLINNS